MKYNFKQIEKKWQKKWEQEKVFETEIDKKKKKFYCLEMFPYASGEGLHIGHALNYTIGDIYARFKRMSGFNVFHPMGYDSFGLPAENAAIKVGKPPKKYTEDAIKNFAKQQKALGWSYDWGKMLSTHWPEYYKWNQFFFLKFLEKGLVYRKKSAANWCPKCNTVLANEQVHNGKCWRHEDTEVEIKHLEQWFLKTTDYADEMLEGIDDLQWPQKIKTMQKNWIGKSYGTEIDFEIEGREKISNVVIVHGCPSNVEKSQDEKTRTYDKHWIPWIKRNLSEKKIEIFIPLMPEPWTPNYENWKKEFDKLDINEESVLIGHSCGCAFLVRWLGETKKKIKKLILVAPWKIADEKRHKESYELKKEFYNYKIDCCVKDNIKEIIIFTANDEEKDGKKSAKIFHDALGGEIIELQNHGHFTLGDMGTKEFPKLLEEIISNKKFPVFTTRPDTIYGVTFMVVSAQHEKLMELVTKEQKKDVEKFLHKIKSVSDKDAVDLAPKGVPSMKGDINIEGKKQGVFTGSYAINPINGDKVPVYAGNFVVAEYGSGMVMGVPAHDQRDFDFAKKYGLEIREVVSEKRNCIIIHGSNPKDKERTKEGKLPPKNKRGWLVWVKNELEKKGVNINIPLMPNSYDPKYEDWKKELEKLAINENSILIGHSTGGAFLVRWLGDTKKKVKKLILVAPITGKEKCNEWLKDFSNFKIDSKIKNNIEERIIFVSNNDNDERLESAKIYQRELKAELIELKGRGHFIEKHMGTKEFPELLEKIIELNKAYTFKGILINSEKFNKLDNEKAKLEITKYLTQKKLGRKSVQFKMRDWLISRQRYWGTPIPVVYCDECGVIPVSEKELPVVLPEKVKFGKGNPLATNEKFVNVKCPKCNSKARRETDTMDTFFDSSWYFLRYCDPKNSKKPFDKEKVKYWMPVDQYIGGAEHACMHLLYARFFTKALRDLGFADFDEPFIKLFNQGMLHASDGRKMSKSLGNVINPSDVVQTKGADALRLTLMSFASPDSDTGWDDKVLYGSLRFLTKVYEKFNKIKISKSKPKIESKLNKTIKEVTNQVENFKYNLAVIKIRDLFNSLSEEESKDVLEKSLKLLHLFCPHITEELWEKIRGKGFISLSKWPKPDEKKIDEKFEKQDEMIKKLKSDIEKIKKLINNRNPKVYVYVLPNELELYSEVKDIEIFAVNDKKKYDPENKSKKVKPGRPGIYLK